LLMHILELVSIILLVISIMFAEYMARRRPLLLVLAHSNSDNSSSE
jgi:hypothetical protein